MDELTVSFEPREMEAAANRIRDLRAVFLRDADTDNACVMSEEHFHLALASLEQAERFMKLASYHQARANAETRRY
jgi:hypothetical protein